MVTSTTLVGNEKEKKFFACNFFFLCCSTLMIRLYPGIRPLRTGVVHFSTKQAIRSSLWTIPNVLTYTRIITTPFLGYYITTVQSTAALLLFTYSCVTDFVDGYIARKYNMKSIVGSIVDPLADKLLMTVCTVSLGYVHAIPPVIASIIIGRDVMLSFMSFYYRYKSLPAPKTFDKFISIGQIPTISVHPNMLGKINTALQMVYIGSLVYRPLVESVVSGAVYDGLGLVVGATTLASGANYLFSKSSWRYVK